MRAVKTVQECAPLVGLNVQLRDSPTVSVTYEQVCGVGPNKTGWAPQLRSGLIHFIPFNHRWFQAGSIRIDLPTISRATMSIATGSKCRRIQSLGTVAFVSTIRKRGQTRTASIVAALAPHEGKGTNDSDEG